ncbi:transcriptional regulator [Pseudomonas syringae ICMP 11168]|uniref:MocR-like B6 salvage transcription factor PtsJ n=1 Tax=Pseudomonas syringae group TaxID=136849 RepID=UPI0007308412|nr:MULTISPECIES: transcriptional regulator PtsJ [Pseudomonas syringae group]KTC04962.1 transcriptional regulator [Pseudomonas syringae ICMP 11168]
MKIKGKTSLEIFESVRELVWMDKIRPGESLPPVRELAEILGVNRNTVSSAYQRLAKAGIAITQGRLGTTICEPRKVGEQEGLSMGSALIDLADGNPNPAWLTDLRTLPLGCLPGPMLYGEETFLPELRELSREWFSPDCPDAYELELTHGAVDAMERLASAHLVPGDKVAVEEPCFLGTINAFRLASMQMQAVAIDEFGMKPDAMEEALQSGARAVLITPRSQNPTGASLSEQRAATIKSVLSRYPNVLVIIDDHFSLLAETPYHSVIPESTLHWALVRSVSKGLGPDLRLAIVACDSSTATQLRARLSPGMSWVSHILQAIVWTLLTSPEVRARLEAARLDYSRRRLSVERAFKNQGIEPFAASGGLNVWLPLVQDEKDFAYAMAKRGWLVRMGSAFSVLGKTQAIRITISKIKDDQIERLAIDLKRAMLESGRS